MDIGEKVKKELIYLNNKKSKGVATVSTTSRDSLDFLVLPRREALGFQIISFLVSSQMAAEKCLKELDGKVESILIDVEAKKAIDLLDIAKNVVKSTRIFTYKPNDATLESADIFLRTYYKEELNGKNFLIIGAGNLGSKLSLRLAERGSNVFLFSRNYNKTKQITTGLNYVLPRQALNKIKPLEFIDYNKEFYDAVISFVPNEQVILPKLVNIIKNKGLVIDGGINNIKDSFFDKSVDKELKCIRLDVRLGFVYSLIFLMDEVNNFFENIQGEISFSDYKLVAGGIIGNLGDIILDQINSPTQIVGIANGIGGVKSESEYTTRDYEKIKEVTKYFLFNNKENV